MCDGGMDSSDCLVGERMSLVVIRLNRAFFVFFTCLGFWLFLSCMNSQMFFRTDYVLVVDVSNNSNSFNSRDNFVQVIHELKQNSSDESESNSSFAQKTIEAIGGSSAETDACFGRYIFVHDLPLRFNYDMLKDCESLSIWSNMCLSLANYGLGPSMFDSGNSRNFFTAFFSTDQFSLDVIFHSRMKQYQCLTTNSSLASAIFVPFYAGLEVGRHLWGFNSSVRDAASLDLMKWLRYQPEWAAMDGTDHFLVAGRISWDFRRMSDKETDWGSNLLKLPESKNMTFLVIESSPWSTNDVAIPYPTYFHPSKHSQILQWQNRMRKQRRRFLFSFAGGPRKNLRNSIREEIIKQCKASRRRCFLLGCSSSVTTKCKNPMNVMKIFQDSVFCLQPPGDSYTRRSTFDSILAGCIPVFFHPGSAYVQYLWHFPKNYTKYSVFIRESEVKRGKVRIEKVLSGIGKAEVAAMREEVIRLIPRIVYADPRSKDQSVEDAFDAAIEGVLERVDVLRGERREGRNSSLVVAEGNSWKYNLLGSLKAHEWDPFFSRTKRG